MKNYSAGKLLSNEEVSLVEILRSSEGKVIFAPLTKKIAWVEETESTIRLYYKDKLLKEYSTFNDYYGYQTSKEAAIKDAKEMVERLELDPKSGLVFKVLQTTKRIPMVLTEEPTPKRKLIGNTIENQMFENNSELLTELKGFMETPWGKDSDGEYERNQEIRNQIEIKTRTVSENVVVWDSVTGS